MATIKDVSQLSGISIATVSKYLNGVPVRQKTQEKIKKAIDELGYRPNPMARGLRNSCTMTIGVLVDNITNNFYNTIISSLSALLREHGYSCLIHEARNSDPEQFNAAVDFLSEKKIDGLFILANYIPESTVKKLEGQFRNVVVIDCIAGGIVGDFVLTDNLSAAYQATEQFIIQNHKNIAIITGHSDNFSASERLNGYLRALQDHNITVNGTWILQDDYDINGGYRAFERLIRLPPESRPTAVLITSYFMTVGAVIALNEHGLSIPGDISVICFDNYDINKVFKPALSCIIQPSDAISNQAVSCMLERISADEVPVNRILRLPPQMLQGESVKTCK